MKNTDSQNKDSKKIFALIVLIATLMITETGATYAWFALTASNSTAIAGNAATAALQLTITKNAPTTVKPMVPQTEAGLGTAMNGTNKCQDGNLNTVCHVYTIAVKNNSTAGVKITSTIKFTHSADVISNGSLTTKGMPNLKWRKTTNATTLGSNSTTDASIITAQTIEANKSLATGATATYYIVIWINETGAAQSDTGTWSATIDVNSSAGGGLTSTITA